MLNTKIHITLLLFILALCSCSNQDNPIVSLEDVNPYLELTIESEITATKDNYQFWKNKLDAAPNQYPYLVKMATVERQLFDLTGEIEYLNQAMGHLEMANEIASNNSSSILRQLAATCITFHRFNDALVYLQQAEELGDDLEGTEKMLFDVHFELGNNALALQYLEKHKNYRDFDYVIRKARWVDSEGDLEQAVKLMEDALALAKSSKKDELMAWSHANLADFYGHDGQIARSAEHYKMALELNSSDAHALEGLAWIAYSWQNDATLARQMIESLGERYQSPSHALFLAELAEFDKQEDQQQVHLNQYLDLVQAKDYGIMYDGVTAELIADMGIDVDRARELAESEVSSRPTPETYSILAWTYFQAEEYEVAQRILDEHVYAKTYEPAIQYRMATVYQLAEDNEKVNVLRRELLGSAYELGPVTAAKIKAL